MNRKKPKFNLAKAILRQTSPPNLKQGKQTNNEMNVNIYLGPQRYPYTITVPHRCNMKILKSMLWFNIKKMLTTTQFNKIAGFQCAPSNYQLDYQMQHGIGQLQSPVNLNCFLKNNKYPPTSILNYKICKIISVGGFSKVYLLRDHRTGQFLAGKFILKQPSTLNLIYNQYQIASLLDHPFITKTHSLIETEHFFVIIMDYLPGGQLFQLLKSNRKMKENSAKFYIIETLLALKYLHQQNIIYRDIKPENIILDQLGHIKLTDFGLAKHNKQKSFSFCGSLDYMAPEVLQQDGYSFQVDYYSVGNLLYEILLGSPPFYHPKFTTEQTKYHILNTNIAFSDKSNLSSQAKSLIFQLLQKQPSQRLGHFGGINQILSHKWFQGLDIQQYESKNIQPPIKIELKMNAPIDQPQQQLLKCRQLIDKDLKQQHIKLQYHSRKIKGNRHRSLNSRTSYEQSHSSPPKEQLKRSQSKLKSNLSLLFVLTHKRSTSQYPTKNNFKTFFSNHKKNSHSALKSLNLSRKSSDVDLSKYKQTTKTSKIKLLTTKHNSQIQLHNNFVLGGNHKYKQNNFIKKKCKEPRTIVKFAKERNNFMFS